LDVLVTENLAMSPVITLPQTPTVGVPSGALDWHVVLASLADGQVAAWIAEWPDCRVVASTRTKAIEAIQALLVEQAKTIEVISIPMGFNEAVKADNPWQSLYGLFEADANFSAWADEFWAAKQRSHDGDEMLSIEECLRVM
jgi:hypothetical protein